MQSGERGSAWLNKCYSEEKVRRSWFQNPADGVPSVVITPLSQFEVHPHFRTNRNHREYTRLTPLPPFLGQWNWMLFCLKRIGWQHLPDVSSVFLETRFNPGDGEEEYGFHWLRWRRTLRLALLRIRRFLWRSSCSHIKEVAAPSWHDPEQERIMTLRVEIQPVSGS